MKWEEKWECGVYGPYVRSDLTVLLIWKDFLLLVKFVKEVGPTHNDEPEHVPFIEQSSSPVNLHDIKIRTDSLINLSKSSGFFFPTIMKANGIYINP